MDRPAITVLPGQKCPSLLPTITLYLEKTGNYREPPITQNTQ
jgi:hypothetical protein